jgi:hypothetical protein
MVGPLGLVGLATGEERVGQLEQFLSRRAGLTLGGARLGQPRPVTRIIGFGCHQPFVDLSRLCEIARVQVLVGGAQHVGPRLTRKLLLKVQFAQRDE